MYGSANNDNILLPVTTMRNNMQQVKKWWQLQHSTVHAARLGGDDNKSHRAL